jgi:hypothetical protein
MKEVIQEKQGKESSSLKRKEVNPGYTCFSYIRCVTVSLSWCELSVKFVIFPAIIIVEL